MTISRVPDDSDNQEDLDMAAARHQHIHDPVEMQEACMTSGSKYLDLLGQIAELLRVIFPLRVGPSPTTSHIARLT